MSNTDYDSTKGQSSRSLLKDHPLCRNGFYFSNVKLVNDMKKICIVLVVFFGISLTSCDRVETEKNINPEKSLVISSSPGLKTGKDKSAYSAIFFHNFKKLWKKLEKKARDKKVKEGDIAYAAEAPGGEIPIPPIEIWEELDEPTKAEFIEDMTPASTSLVENEFQSDCSQAQDVNIVLAALIADHLYAAADDGYVFERIAPANYVYYTPPGSPADEPQSSVAARCILEALVNMGAIVGSGVAIGIIVDKTVGKQVTYAAIKKVVESILLSISIQAEVTGPALAAIIGGAAVVTITFDTLRCIAVHYIWNVE